jgi:hypothetical protein
MWTYSLGKSGERVSRRLDLRDHGDVSRTGEGHHLADLLLGVEAAVRLAVETLRPGAGVVDDGLLADGGDLGEPRVAPFSERHRS